MIQLAKLEEELLENLSNADPDTILDNKELIISLETTKATSIEIAEKQKVAQVTEALINESRNVYRIVAAEGAMLYFLLIQLCVVEHMYQYSLGAFTTFFFKAFEKTEQYEEEDKRVVALQKMIRQTIYQWVARGLFERHKLIFMAQIMFRLMAKKIVDVEYTAKEFSFLVYCPMKTENAIPETLVEWLPEPAWYSIQKLGDIEGFETFS